MKDINSLEHTKWRCQCHLVVVSAALHNFTVFVCFITARRSILITNLLSSTVVYVVVALIAIDYGADAYPITRNL
jgi:hypothetical protein